MKVSSKKHFQEIDINLVHPPKSSVRLEIPQDKIIELADSIASQGLLQPILIRVIENGYETVAGDRRLKACQYLGLEKISAMVVVMDDVAVGLARASENMTREDLSPIEEAMVYKELRDDLGLSVDAIAKKMGKSVGVVKRRIDLLKMPPELQRSIHDKKISYGVAEELWSLGDETAISYYLEYAVEHGITVMVARQWVKDWRDRKRREVSDVGGGGEPLAPFEPRPTYVTCDVCFNPEEISKVGYLCACEKCRALVKEARK